MLWEDEPVATVWGELPDGAVQRCLVTGTNRTFDQDPLLAFRLLEDIGLRALSPAVSDPATAAAALDAVVGLLTPLATRDLADEEIRSASGTVTIVLRLPTWDDFVGEGLDEISGGGAGVADGARPGGRGPGEIGRTRPTRTRRRARGAPPPVGGGARGRLTRGPPGAGPSGPAPGPPCA